MTPEEYESLLARDSRNGARIFPYLGGQEVNSSPTQSFDRYVINFRQMQFNEAERWPDLMTIVREKVKPERDRNKREQRRKYWWRFGETTPALFAALEPLTRCLVAAVVSKHLMFSFQPTDRVFSHKLYVFPLESFTSFAVLQSRVHVLWAWLLSSTMKTDLNYSASDCFATFPFPQPDPRTVVDPVEATGKALYDTRAAFMIDSDQGLTKTYNALKDPDNQDPRIIELRQLHESMDRAVLAAYKWSDIEVPPFCPATSAEKRALQNFEDEIIDRLYVLNAERAVEEKRLGLHAKKSVKSSTKKRKTRSKKAKAKKSDQGELF